MTETDDHDDHDDRLDDVRPLHSRLRDAGFSDDAACAFDRAVNRPVTVRSFNRDDRDHLDVDGLPMYVPTEETTGLLVFPDAVADALAKRRHREEDQ